MRIPQKNCEALSEAGFSVVCNVLMFLWIVFGENAIDYCFCA